MERYFLWRVFVLTFTAVKITYLNKTQREDELSVANG